MKSSKYASVVWAFGKCGRVLLQYKYVSQVSDTGVNCSSQLLVDYPINIVYSCPWITLEGGLGLHLVEIIYFSMDMVWYGSVMILEILLSLFKQRLYDCLCQDRHLLWNFLPNVNYMDSLNLCRLLKDIFLQIFHHVIDMFFLGSDVIVLDWSWQQEGSHTNYTDRICIQCDLDIVTTCHMQRMNSNVNGISSV